MTIKVDFSCPNCRKTISVDIHRESLHCDLCGAQIQLNKDKHILSLVRYDNAIGFLDDARILVERRSFKAAYDRMYFAELHAIRAMLALHGINSTDHKEVVSEFNKYFPSSDEYYNYLSSLLDVSLRLRTKCDFDDFYDVSDDTAISNLAGTEYYLNIVGRYLPRLKDVVDKSTLDNIVAIMDSFNCDAQKAMDTLKIPAPYRPLYLARLGLSKKL